MLKPTQYSKELFDKARRMARYSSGYLTQFLIDRDGVNEGDAAIIVHLAKELSALETVRNELAVPFNEAWCTTGLKLDSAVTQVMKKTNLGEELCRALIELARRLDALDYDQSNTNHMDTMGAW